MHTTHVRLGFVGRVFFTLAVAMGGTGTLLYAAADGARLSLSRMPAVAGALGSAEDAPVAPLPAGAQATACTAERPDVC